MYHVKLFRDSSLEALEKQAQDFLNEVMDTVEPDSDLLVDVKLNPQLVPVQKSIADPAGMEMGFLYFLTMTVQGGEHQGGLDESEEGDE